MIVVFVFIAWSPVFLCSCCCLIVVIVVVFVVAYALSVSSGVTLVSSVANPAATSAVGRGPFTSSSTALSFVWKESALALALKWPRTRRRTLAAFVFATPFSFFRSSRRYRKHSASNKSTTSELTTQSLMKTWTAPRCEGHQNPGAGHDIPTRILYIPVEGQCSIGQGHTTSCHQSHC